MMHDSSEYPWVKTRIAWGKKLVLILSVLALREWKHLPDLNSEKRPLLGWERSIYSVFCSSLKHVYFPLLQIYFQKEKF